MFERILSAACAAMIFAGPASAATIVYGNYNIPSAGITFTQVTESSSTDAVPLYSAPSPFVVGLDFNPTAFGASSAGGGGDITDGQLNFGVVGTVNLNQVTVISSLALAELGDYTLVGTGTNATQVFAGAIMHIKVTHIDGIDVPDISLSPSNASIGFDLVSNPGIVQPWGLGVSINVTAALNSLAVPFQFGATQIEVVIDNTLVAISEPLAVASIQKKDFVISIDETEHLVPEPASLALIFMGGSLIFARRRR